MLEPCAKKSPGRAEQLQVVGAVSKVASVHLRGTQVFEVVERRKLSGSLVRSEEEPEGFAGQLNASGKGVVRQLLEPRKRGPGLPIIKDKTTAARPGSDVAHSRTKGVEREIRHDPQPREEGRGSGIEASGDELCGKRLVLEVDRDEGEAKWDRNATTFEQPKLPSLRRGMVNLKDPELCVRISRTYCVTPCATALERVSSA